MFNLGAKHSVRGAGHIILHILRPLTIIALLSIIASSWVMIVFSGLTAHFSFFDTMSHAFVSATALALIASEVDMFRLIRHYFDRNWPTLGSEHSLGWLGMIMIALGCQLLGNLDKVAYSQENLGLPMWRLVLASGILGLAFGFLNMLGSVIFRDGSQGITAREIRRSGAIAAPAPNKSEFYDGYPSMDNYPAPLQRAENLASQRSQNSLRQQEVAEDSGAAPVNRRITKIFNVKNFRKSKLQISNPILAPQQADAGRADEDDFRGSPIVPHLQRPPTAMHPAYTGGSRYSEAHMPRWSRDDATAV